MSDTKDAAAASLRVASLRAADLLAVTNRLNEIREMTPTARRRLLDRWGDEFPGDFDGPSGFGMRRWAEGLIVQLPADHEGRLSWLLNHGRGDEAQKLRARTSTLPLRVTELPLGGWSWAQDLQVITDPVGEGASDVIARDGSQRYEYRDMDGKMHVIGIWTHPGIYSWLQAARDADEMAEVLAHYAKHGKLP